MPPELLIQRPQIEQQPQTDLGLVDRFLLDQELAPLVKDKTSVPDVFKDAFKAPEEAKDINMDVPWSSFGQMFFVKEHELKIGDEVKKVKKIAAISISYPSGVRTRMTEAIIKNTLSPDISIQHWNGVEEGELQAASIDHGKEEPNLSVLDRFIDVSENVIAASHQDVSHEYVQHFLGLQDTRREFMSTVKEDVRTILDDPTFLKKSAFDPRYKDKGVYVLEMYMDEAGELYGVDPKGNPMRIIDIAADEPHKDWLVWLKNDVSQGGNSTKIHADGTETVSGCDGNKRACAEYFEEMEGNQRAKIVFEKATYRKLVTLPTISMSWGGENNKVICINRRCKGECTCGVTTAEASGSANGEAA